MGETSNVLIPPALVELFAAYTETNKEVEDPVVVAKYYLQGTDMRWYATQFEEERFYGFAAGCLCPGWEGFTVAHFKRCESHLGGTVCRDEDFTPTPFSTLFPKSLENALLVTEDTSEGVRDILNLGNF